MGINRSIIILLAFAVALPVFADGLPITYLRIAQKHDINAIELYQLALAKTGHQAQFTQTKTPWPFALEMCKDKSCTLEQPSNRTELFDQATNAIKQGFAVSIGPALLDWDNHKNQIGGNLWIATDPVVTLNLTAKFIAEKVQKPKLVKSLATNEKIINKTTTSSDIIRRRVAVVIPHVSTNPHREAPATATLINQWVDQLSSQYDLDPELVKAVIKHESNYNPEAVSHAGAVGLMQLMPATGRAYGVPVESRTDPLLNIKGGMAFLKDLSQVYDNDIMLMLAAYNAGETAVTKYGNTIPPYPETVQYVLKVMNTYLKRIGGRSA